jgi:hypothetical protein
MAGASPKWLRRVVVLVAIAVVAGFAFWRTVKSARSSPYTLGPQTHGVWRLTVEPGTGPRDPVLLLEPPVELSRELFDQVFKRSMESMRAPEAAGIPLVLAGELERAGAARLPPDALVAMAREAGLEAAPPMPRCIGHRRAPEPDTRQQAYFALFDSPAFAAFRASLAARLGPTFDPGAMAPAALVGVIESRLDRWLPLHADEKDCLAPIESASGS